MTVRSIAFSRLVILLGLACWLALAVINNITDSGTNTHLLGKTLSMELLMDDGTLGSGIIWRALSPDWALAVLTGVIVAQIGVVVLLGRAALSYARAMWKNDEWALEVARSHAFPALSSFIMLWVFFICGGLWFGYWIKQGQIQIVHMTLIIIGIASLGVIQNHPSPVRGHPSQST